MQFFSRADFHRKRALALTTLWLAGLVFGVFCAESAPELVASMVRSAAGQTPYLWSILWSACFPFLLSAFAVQISESLLLPVCFFKACAFGFCGHGVGLAFGSGAWLIRLLLLFSDLILIPLLFLFWLRGPSKRALAICLTVAITVGALDRFLIAPFLVGLI